MSLVMPELDRDVLGRRAEIVAALRTIVPGEAFFAITGDSRDGHEFVDAALKARGA